MNLCVQTDVKPQREKSQGPCPSLSSLAGSFKVIRVSTSLNAVDRMRLTQALWINNSPSSSSYTLSILTALGGLKPVSDRLDFVVFLLTWLEPRNSFKEVMADLPRLCGDRKSEMFSGIDG